MYFVCLFARSCLLRGDLVAMCAGGAARCDAAFLPKQRFACACGHLFRTRLLCRVLSESFLLARCCARPFFFFFAAGSSQRTLSALFCTLARRRSAVRLLEALHGIKDQVPKERRRVPDVVARAVATASRHQGDVRRERRSSTFVCSYFRNVFVVVCRPSSSSVVRDRMTSVVVVLVCCLLFVCCLLLFTFVVL